MMQKKFGTGDPKIGAYVEKLFPEDAILKEIRERSKKAGFEKQAQIFVGPASDNLPQVEKEGPFDLVFLDADKTGYLSYFKWAEKHLRVGGVVLADNTFGWGKIADTAFSPSDDEETDVKGLQEFNKAVAKNPRFKTTLLPTGEGLLMAVKLS